MPNYAKVVDEVVIQVIVADADFFQEFKDSSPGKWILAPDDNSVGIGHMYDENSKKFSVPETMSIGNISYPSVQDQLLSIWNSMDSGEIPKSKAFYNSIKTINDKYPKPA